MDVVLESGIPASQVIIQSFTPDNLDVAEQRMPDAQFALLSLAGTNDLAIDVAASNGWDWVSPAWPMDEAYVEQAHGRKLKVIPYTINQARRVGRGGEGRRGRPDHGRPADGAADARHGARARSRSRRSRRSCGR